MSWMNVSRALKVLALVLFLTPWLVVSCQGSPLIEASGLDLITGNVEPSPDGPMGPLSSPPDAEAGADGDASAPDGTSVLDDGRWWALAGALLIGIGLVLGGVLKPVRTAALGAAAAGTLALAALGGGMAWTDHSLDRERREAVEGQAGGGDDMERLRGTMAAEALWAIQLEVKAGYWWTLVALGLGVGATLMAAGGARLPRIVP